MDKTLAQLKAELDEAMDTIYAALEAVQAADVADTEWAAVYNAYDKKLKKKNK